jgi:peptidoglycan/LPS O-acetylase OafA/YrhL
LGLIRLLLAVSVVFAHAGGSHWKSMVGGELAVQGFFMISGFYMALILAEKYVGAGAIKVFWINRALKIYPAYWFVLLITISYTLARYLIAKQPPPPIIMSYTTPFDALQNQRASIGEVELIYIGVVQVILFFLDSVMFVKPAGHFFSVTTNFSAEQNQLWLLLFVPQAWTLSLELMFYLIAPLLIRFRVRWLVMLILVSASLRDFIYHGLSLSNDPWSYRFFPTEFAFFLIGFVGYKIFKGIAPSDDRLFNYVGIALCSLVIGSIILFPELGNRPRLFLLLLGVSIPFIFAATKEWRVDRILGEISYPLYVVHFLVIIVCRDIAPGAPSSSHYGFIIAAISIGAAFALNALVMSPIENLRKHFAVRAVRTASSATSDYRSVTGPTLA